MRPDVTPPPPPVGLCLSCAHSQPVTSVRGSMFYLCRRSTTDSRFPRYPALPVLSCQGYERQPAGDES